VYSKYLSSDANSGARNSGKQGTISEALILQIKEDKAVHFIRLITWICAIGASKSIFKSVNSDIK